MSRWHFKKSQFLLAGRMESTEEIFKMDTEEYPPELENSHSSDQLVPETDAKSSFRTSPLPSPSYQLHLLRLSSDSDYCFEALSPFSPCSMEFSLIEQIHYMGEGPIKEHQKMVRFDSGYAVTSQFMVEMESVNENVDGTKSGQQEEERKRLRSDNLNSHADDYNPTKYSQLTGQVNAIEQSSGKHTQPSRRNSHSNLKEQSKTESPTTHQNAVPSDYTIPSTSHLALRRKLKSQASQDPSRAKTHGHMNFPLPLKSPIKKPRQPALSKPQNCTDPRRALCLSRNLASSTSTHKEGLWEGIQALHRDKYKSGKKQKSNNPIFAKNLPVPPAETVT